jgi:release factor glutamine methyltransferase
MESTVAAPELLEWRREQLQAGGEASALDWLLDLEGGIPWQTLQQLWLHPEQSVQLATPLSRLEQLWQQHLQRRTPLQYLVGRCPWRDLELAVQPGALIPRQETELLVDLALDLIKRAESEQPLRWADLGTGSGCLALALARAWPNSEGWAVDQSAEALALAKRNLNRDPSGQAVQLRLGSWWEPLGDCLGSLNLVVANPPYIPTDVWQALDPVVRDHEPELALHGGSDGLDSIRAIASGAAAALAPGGWLLLEHHHDQSEAVLNVLRESGLHNAAAHLDLEGVKRFACAQRTP